MAQCRATPQEQTKSLLFGLLQTVKRRQLASLGAFTGQIGRQ
jgi:hypothetical protein